MPTDQATWTLPTLIVLPILILIALLLLGVLIFSVQRWLSWDDSDYAGAAAFCGFCLVLVVGLGLFGFWPPKAEYHQWRTMTGTVQEVNKRLMTNGDGQLQERYVVVYKESGEAFACDDTRCSLVKVGEPLTLACKKEWQYGSTDGWGCRFKSYELAKS